MSVVAPTVLTILVLQGAQGEDDIRRHRVSSDVFSQGFIMNSQTQDMSYDAEIRVGVQE